MGNAVSRSVFPVLTSLLLGGDGRLGAPVSSLSLYKMRA